MSDEDWKTLRSAVEGFARTAEAAVREHETRNDGGMRVPFHGDFAGAQPSIIVRLRWWAERMREGLAALSRLEAEAAALREALERGLVRWSMERSWCTQCRTETPQAIDEQKRRIPKPHEHAPECILGADTGRAMLERVREAEEVARLKEVLLQSDFEKAGEFAKRAEKAERAYEHHLAGCAIEREELLQLGMVDDNGEDCAGIWRNARAEAAEAERDALREQVEMAKRQRDEAREEANRAALELTEARAEVERLTEDVRRETTRAVLAVYHGEAPTEEQVDEAMREADAIRAVDVEPAPQPHGIGAPWEEHDWSEPDADGGQTCSGCPAYAREVASVVLSDTEGESNG